MRHLPTIPALIAALALSGCGHPDELLAAQSPTKQEAAKPAPASQTASVALHPPAETRQPFIVIRFEGTQPEYAEALYNALQSALTRKPDAAFDLVAVTRDTDAAKRNLASVMRSMTEMGMPAERLSLAAVAAADDATDEVWIYVR